MRYCKHTQWLGLAVNDGDVVLQNTDRLQTLLDDLPNPDKQTPSLFVFIGNKSKAMAIKELAKTFSPPPKYSCHPSKHNDESSWEGQTRLNGRRVHGEIHLHIHPPSVFSSRPVLLAEGDLPNLSKLTSSLAIEKCHETDSRPLNASTLATPTLSESADRIYFRLLSPFTDVFCFFADDIGKFKPIVQRLALWLDLGQPSTLPKSTRPKVLIVTERDVAHGNDESDLVAFKRMLSNETTIDFSEQFSDIQILGLASRKKNLSNKARHRELFERLLNFSDQVREARITAEVLFSAHHLTAFFHHALRHINSPVPFNLISASQSENPVTSDLRDHLVNFLGKIRTPEKLLQFAIPVIASSFILNSYPPDMHFFNPAEVYCNSYKEICRQVCRTGVLAHEGSTHLILPSSFTRLLELEFVKQAEAFAKLDNVSSAIKYVFGVFRRHGDKSDVWNFEIRQCFLCKSDTPGVNIKVRPPTATARLLSIDGGGARGIIPLVFLQALEERIGLPYPVQGNFDFVFGTSSGGIIALALSQKGLSVEDCMDLFERLAKRAFELHHISYIRAILVSLFTNGIYPARNIERALRDVFGSNETILDCSSATAMGTKIGVVASTMKPEPFLFTNYNGLGDRKGKKYDYSVLRGNALVWEIARSTSAAPGIFTPKKIEGLGKFQDGGLQFNNPTKLALAEIKEFFPNDLSAKRSTLKVSLGTGKAPEREPELHGSNSWWKDLWFFRLCRVLWSSMDGQESSDAIYNKEANSVEDLKTVTNKRRGEYFRFNLEFRSQQPRLDDSSKIPEMKALAQGEVALQLSQLDQLAHCLIAELFVFELELESVPRKENGKYSCTGYILCCHRAGSPAFNALLRRLTGLSAAFLLRGHTLPGSVQDRSSLARDGNFRKRVCFDVTSKEDLVSLQLQERGSEPYHISGSPFSVNWLIEAQGLGRPFGRRDGVKRKRKDTNDREVKKRQRLY
ncbi:hypothetical protein VE04_05114 [Pseudogymnoascus sp. 24MN13]|nr:hypothetical protein VE04_05114 [Pseudogymnoascus sp. 24MN13]